MTSKCTETFVGELEQLEVLPQFNLLDSSLKRVNGYCFRRASRSWVIFSERDIETEPAKVERVCDPPVPENATEELLRTCQLLSTLYS